MTTKRQDAFFFFAGGQNLKLSLVRELTVINFVKPGLVPVPTLTGWVITQNILLKGLVVVV